MRGFWISVCVLMMAASALAAPIEEELVAPDLTVDVRALGMAGATVSRARGMDALLTNPAGLAALAFSEASASGAYRDLGVETGLGPRLSNVSATPLRLGHVGIVYRSDAYSRLGLGASIHQARELELRSLIDGRETQGAFDGFQIAEDRDTEGAVYSLALGAGFEALRGVRVGITVHQWDGDRTRNIRFEARDAARIDGELTRAEFGDSIRRLITATRVKVGGEIGLVPELLIGGTVTLPSDVDIQEDWRQLTTYVFDDGSDERSADQGFTDYTLRLPAEFEGGVTLRSGFWRLSGSLRYVDWTGAEYAPAPARDVSRRQFAQFYESATEGRLGAEYWLPDGVALRAGARVGTNPLGWKETTQTPLTLTAGVGIPLTGDFYADIAYALDLWEREGDGLTESFTSNRVVVGGRLLF